MRGYNRIDEFCNSLANNWNKVPDWRFGQLVWNVISACQKQGKDAFYMEDDEMREFIKNYIKEITKDA